MQSVSAGQNIILTGYISCQGAGNMVGELKESVSVKQSGLSERLTEIRNSAAEFFTAVKGKINNAFESLGNLINKIIVRDEKMQFDPDQAVRESLTITQEKVPEYLNKIREFLDNNEPLTPASLKAFSTFSLRPLVTFLSGGDKIAGAHTGDVINRVKTVLSGTADCGPEPSEKVNQLGSVSDDKKAADYLATDDFERQFKTRMMTLMTDIEKQILPQLMRLSPADIFAQPESKTGNDRVTEHWRLLPDH